MKKRSEVMNVNMKPVDDKRSVVVNSNLPKKTIAKLSTELMNKLESKETNFKSITELHGRLKIVNWIEVMDFCIEQKWVTMKMIKDFVLTNYNKNKLYDSEVLRFLRSERTNKLVHVISKEIKSGEDKNIYYKLTKK